MMKSTYLSLAFICLSFFGHSQVVISEIMYNPPESGTDSLEYIEITNAGLVAVDISGYHFLQGVVDTVAAGTILPAGAAYVFSENSNALNNVLGVSSDQWIVGALSNEGEAIELADANNLSIDLVNYDNGAGWPDEDAGTDGQGGSIELCDLLSDNALPENWAVSETDTGVELNGNNILGTPGTTNSGMCAVIPNHIIDATPNNVFLPADVTINVGEVVEWINQGGSHNVNGQLSTFPDNPDEFYSGAPASTSWTFSKMFSVEGVYDYQCDLHAGLGMVGTVTVIDPDANLFPNRDIGIMTTIDADGLADSLGVSCTITGVVHGINFETSGLSFTIINGFDQGIGVFSSSENFGYVVNEGDVLQIAGVIIQTAGLIQIEPMSITEAGSDNLMVPREVTILDETTESELVFIKGGVPDFSSWLGDGSSFNFNFESKSGEVIVVVIDNDTELSTMAAPECFEYEIRGLGSQFDIDAPYLSGYQLFPRYVDDIRCFDFTNDLHLGGTISINPNPVINILNVESEQDLEKLEISNLTGQIIHKQKFGSSIDVSALTSGVYMITFYNGNRSKTIKFVKE